ncbi:putative disease resistance protein At3g14460 [Vitis riparia]|uniref:putative disease resistance protein At3g14460 n=1 Tax=Vitis riparia TaxID=96939 RepID=UPI00155A6D94|nr:putative disease resistance protein At3g14460 [Vitis riparia]
MESRVRGMIALLEKIALEKVGFVLAEGGGEKLSPRPRSPISTSLEDESIVLGRDEIQKETVKWLLSDNTTGEKMEVMSIVGMGGSGKTTLARLLYNNEGVKEHFHLKAWVCVSTEFLLIKVTKTILEEIGSKTDSDNLNKLQLELKDQLGNKKFMLVLDDIWNLKPRDEGYMELSDLEGWNSLRTPLLAAAQGSKIIVTSRDQSVATTMRAVRTHHRDSNAFLELEPIGRQIVDKRQGLPLAVKALGCLLRSKVEKREWEDVFDSDIWHLPSGPEILPSLRLSYHHLSLPLKHCFAYCSIFPRNHEFDKEKLILLWMAEGLLHPQQGDKRRMEEIVFCAQEEDDDRVPKVYEKTRHFLYFKSDYDRLVTFKKFEAITKAKSLRTFLESGLRIGELRELSEIRGALYISNMKNVVSVNDALQANMKDKSYLDELILNWESGWVTNGSITQHDATTDDILNSLQPHPNLKQLSITNYPGARFQIGLEILQYS